ncbi:15108_t:CDS:2 [Acaulospora morrowiae]|uniref:15108_t:CDS:1 n=1 Tax=Acaulospora morrowiae TaxID=94023 RepID=A0A9N9DDH2_9GLOM|nr:15108_t:CDS:2 [Acaulospora morrowiae]
MTNIPVNPQIPIIDFSLYDSNQQECIEQIKSACENVGFFYLRNHGFSQESIDEIFDCVGIFQWTPGRSECFADGVDYKNSTIKQFFDQSMEEKIKYNINEHYYGYISMRQEKLDYKNQIMGDSKESFNFCKFDEQDNPLTLTLPPIFKEKKALISRISKDCHKLCLKLLEFLATALEITESEGGKHWFEERHNYGLKSGDCLRIIHYPTVEKIAEKDIRAGMHSDYGSLTVLFQKDIGGLEVLPPNSTEWIPAPVIPDCVLINIGDCLEFWTRGLYKSIKHRVVFNENNMNFDRYSIAYFFHAGRDVSLDPIPSKFVPNDGIEKIGNGEKSLTAGQYLQNKLDVSYKDVIF